MAFQVPVQRAPSRRDGEGGQSLVEYGIIVALIGVVAMVGAQVLGNGVAGVFTRVAGRITGIG
jgi:Flp pilus assembly pilin Flp